MYPHHYRSGVWERDLRLVDHLEKDHSFPIDGSVVRYDDVGFMEVRLLPLFHNGEIKRALEAAAEGC